MCCVVSARLGAAARRDVVPPAYDKGSTGRLARLHQRCVCSLAFVLGDTFKGNVTGHGRAFVCTSFAKMPTDTAKNKTFTTRNSRERTKKRRNGQRAFLESGLSLTCGEQWARSERARARAKVRRERGQRDGDGECACMHEEQCEPVCRHVWPRVFASRVSRILRYKNNPRQTKDAGRCQH